MASHLPKECTKETCAQRGTLLKPYLSNALETWLALQLAQIETQHFAKAATADVNVAKRLTEYFVILRRVERKYITKTGVNKVTYMCVNCSVLRFSSSFPPKSNYGAEDDIIKGRRICIFAIAYAWS